MKMIAKAICKITLAALLWSAVLLFSAEGLLRLLYEDAEIDGFYFGKGAWEAFEPTGLRMAPGFTGRAFRKDVFDTSIQINRFGLRQSNFETQLQYSNRVMLLGDSFTFGVGVEESESFAFLLQTVLNERGWGVINVGQPAFGVTQETALALHLAPLVKPNAIVLHMFLGEDGSDFKDDYLQNYKKIDIRHGYKLRKSRPLPIAPLDYLRTHSYVWRKIGFKLLAHNTKKIMAQFREDAENNPHQVVRNTLDSLDELSDYCRGNSILFGVVIIAEKDVPHALSTILKDHLNTRQISYLDLNEKNFDADNYFESDIHWNSNGHRKAVSYIAPFILKLIQEPTASTNH